MQAYLTSKKGKVFLEAISKGSFNILKYLFKEHDKDHKIKTELVIAWEKIKEEKTAEEMTTLLRNREVKRIIDLIVQ
jgi:hypothetical protein